jgi:hypothetical protein
LESAAGRSGRDCRAWNAGRGIWGDLTARGDFPVDLWPIPAQPGVRTRTAAGAATGRNLEKPRFSAKSAILKKNENFIHPFFDFRATPKYVAVVLPMRGITNCTGVYFWVTFPLA